MSRSVPRQRDTARAVDPVALKIQDYYRGRRTGSVNKWDHSCPAAQSVDPTLKMDHSFSSAAAVGLVLTLLDRTKTVGRFADADYACPRRPPRTRFAEVHGRCAHENGDTAWVMRHWNPTSGCRKWRVRSCESRTPRRRERHRVPGITAVPRRPGEACSWAGRSPAACPQPRSLRPREVHTLGAHTNLKADSSGAKIFSTHGHSWLAWRVQLQCAADALPSPNGPNLGGARWGCRTARSCSEGQQCLGLESDRPELAPAGDLDVRPGHVAHQVEPDDRLRVAMGQAGVRI